MAISKEILIVTATVPESIEEEWNRWYNDVHLPEIAQCPGFQSAQRYVSQALPGRSYVSIYELDDPQALDSTEFSARRGWGPFTSQVKFSTIRYSQIAKLDR